MACHYNWFEKHIRRIIYLLCQKSVALILNVQGQMAMKYPRLAPAVLLPIPMSLPQ